MVPLAGRARGSAGIARHAPRLAAARGRRLFLPRRDGCQSALYARLAVLPVDDGGRWHNSVVQSKPAAGAIDRANNVRLFCSHDAVELKAFAESKGDRTDKSHPVESL